MPQPIDLQTELGRVAALERIQQINDRLSLVAQQQKTNEAQEQRVAAETLVQEAQQKSEQVESELRRRAPYVRIKRHDDNSEGADSDPDEQSAHHQDARPSDADASEGRHLDVSV